MEMIGPQRLLPDRQGAKVERLGLGISALAVVQNCEVIEAAGGIGMIGPQRLLPDRQGAKEEGLGFGVGALAQVQLCEVVKAAGSNGMIVPQRLLFERQGAKVEGLGLGVGTLAVVQKCEVIDALGGIRMIGLQRLLCPGQDLFLQRNRLVKFPLLNEHLQLLYPSLHLRRHHLSASPRLGHQHRLAGRHSPSLHQR